MLKMLKLAAIAALLAAPAVVHAQGVFQQGGAAAGPAGAIVGGAAGGANGVLGIHPRYRHHWMRTHRSSYRRHHRYHRYYY
jgi:hypothetical protein